MDSKCCCHVIENPSSAYDRQGHLDRPSPQPFQRRRALLCSESEPRPYTFQRAASGSRRYAAVEMVVRQPSESVDLTCGSWQTDPWKVSMRFANVNSEVTRNCDRRMRSSLKDELYRRITRGHLVVVGNPFQKVFPGYRKGAEEDGELEATMDS
ncbi:hypothetical protein N657DRAFT_388463 [Parathielavia appendiculata]|uniref:Uncharacterized protein n=1 Tax=Parathielavia appendiculata TaxID=2587402 RepID=A0AAN6U0U2_9PEZI|nr:hypothetical protein N657DRAFT_388463 [Parathielavia appendiculata]